MYFVIYRLKKKFHNPVKVCFMKSEKNEGFQKNFHLIFEQKNLLRFVFIFFNFSNLKIQIKNRCFPILVIAITDKKTFISYLWKT
jgi:hypothetical protein